jgi:hypothetical protein
MMSRIINVTGLLIILVQVGCGAPERGQTQTEAAMPATSGHSTTFRNAKIPVELSYPIIKDEKEYNDYVKKRMVEIRLNMKTTPEVLREIALEVKASEKHQYEMTFIAFLLPEKVPGVPSEYWATCDFNPTLEVKILGLTREAEDAIRKTRITCPGRKIGAWLVESTVGGNVHLIYEDSGSIKVAIVAGKDRVVCDAVELPAQEGRRFQVEGSTEVYDVDPSGVLRMYDDKGRVFAAAPHLE